VIRDLYVENSVGRDLTDTINRFTRNHGVTAHFQHDIHPEMQRPQKGDEWWIADIAARGMAILTQDASILGVRQRLQQGLVTAERQAIIDSGSHVVAFGDAKYTQWQKLRCVLSHWDAIAAILDKPGPQAGLLRLGSFRQETFP
jgi:hypothetical protein